jgi:peptidoglycan-associated lipoprotein
MRKSTLLSAAVVLAACVFAFWGCPKRTETASVPEARTAEKPGADDEASARAREREAAARKEQEEREARERAAAQARGLRPVFFDFDQSHIRRDARDVLKANAEWLKANPKASIRIEGNCDERGTIEYNQALGQRRALSAKKYLADLGIAPGRIALLSYGKERPVCTESAESCWQENRRADFVAVID